MRFIINFHALNDLFTCLIRGKKNILITNLHIMKQLTVRLLLIMNETKMLAFS